jgi:hypothetical protein
MNEQRVLKDIRRLAPWSHNLHLSETVQTFAEHHFGDFPNSGSALRRICRTI